MTPVCFIVLVCKPFDLLIGRKMISLRKNTILLIEPNIRRTLPECSSVVRVIALNSKVVLSFLNDINNNLPDVFHMDKQGGVIEENAPLPLTYALFDGVSIADSHSLSLKEKLCISLLSLFRERERVISFLLTYLNTFTNKITGVMCVDLSRQWHLKDIADMIYASESLIKKKLKEEGTSFSEVLRNLRMESARRMIIENVHSVSVISQKCGYNSTSYFISAFKDYYGMTPTHYHESVISKNFQKQ